MIFVCNSARRRSFQALRLSALNRFSDYFSPIITIYRLSAIALSACFLWSTPLVIMDSLSNEDTTTLLSDTGRRTMNLSLGTSSKRIVTRGGTSLPRPRAPPRSSLLPQYNTRPSTTAPHQQLKLCCVQLGGLPAPIQLTVLSLSVFALSLTSATLDEYIFRSIPGYEFGWFTTMFELSAFSLFALLDWFVSERTVHVHRVAPLQKHAIVALAMTLGRGFANTALTLLNYPTQVLMYRDVSRFSILEYIAAFLLMGSAAMFALVDIEVSPRFSWLGILLVLTSLAFNSVHSNSQEHVLQAYNASVHELMVYGNMCGAGLALVICILNGELLAAIAFCNENPNVYKLLASRMVFAYTSVLCYVLLIKRFGAVLATIVTTTRKVLTVVLSFIVFPKPFHWLYFVAGGLFAAGTCLNLWTKQHHISTRNPLSSSENAKVSSSSQ